MHSKREKRAGGVVYRSGGDARGGTEYLIVTAKGSQTWVLPKGHVELGETAEETAVREVREEAGLQARVEQSLGSIEFVDDGGETVRVDFFLMKSLSQETPTEAREIAWADFETAQTLLTHSESKAILAQAHKRLTAGRPT